MKSKGAAAQGADLEGLANAAVYGCEFGNLSPDPAAPAAAAPQPSPGAPPPPCLRRDARGCDAPLRRAHPGAALGWGRAAGGLVA